jgi:hypothetical protein
MSQRTFASLASRINPSVPGCSLPLIVQHIRTAAVQTCERTLAWRYEQPAFNLTPGKYQYAYNKPTDTEVFAVMHTALNDYEALSPITLDQATELYPGWVRASTTAQDIADNGGQPRYITQVSPSQYNVLPPPNADKTYTLRMIYALKPSHSASEMDEGVMNQLEEAIVSKTLQDLLVLPNTSWSDRELASYHAKQFIARVSEYRAHANLGRMRASLTARAPRFA